MSFILYGIANCDSIKKTKKLFDENDINYQFHDYKKTPPSEKSLALWINKFGAEQVINKRGTTWRKLSEIEKNAAENDLKSQIHLLLEHSSMIKRPIIEDTKRDNMLVGFNKEDIVKFISQ